MRRSPSRAISAPPAGANSSRASAKALTTKEAAAMVTSKDRANWGSTGETRPKPRAIIRAAPASTQISLGSAGRGEVCGGMRSEEHTSELQSRGHLVCRLLLEKKTTEG